MSGLWSGCSGDLPTAPVSGQVTLNGEPLKEGAIVFARKLPDGRFADPKSTPLQSDGTFYLRAHVGENLIKVDIPGVVTLDPEGMAKKTGRNIPALMRYASLQLSGLSFNVPDDGSESCKIELRE